MTNGLHWIDGAIVAIYACGMVALGWYYSRKQQNTDEYFVGNRAMNPILIGVSLFVTLFSTISFLATPGELISHGPMTLAGDLSIPFGYFIVGYLIVPVYMRFRVVSAYEILESKLGVGARLMGASIFVLLRLMWMATLIFLASKAMLVMLGLDHKWLPVVTFAAGSISIFYSSLGGLRAVVITDLLQFLLLFGGAILVIITASVHLGGFGWFPTQWNATWDTQPLFSFDPAVRVTVFGSIVRGALWWVCTAGSDQTAIQRFMATKDARAARRSFLVNSIAGVAVSIVLALVAFSLLGFYQADPERLPPGMTVAENADFLFPYFISHHLPVGLSGLVVSGMFAAAMSSLDSGINSITAVVTTDFVDRFRKHSLTEKSHVLTARLLACGIGLAVVTASSFMEHVPGNFLEMSQRTIGLFVSPLFTLFFMAIFIPFASQTGTILGAMAGLLAGGIVAYWEQLPQLVAITGLDTFSFQWIIPISLVVGVVVGCLLSLVSPGDKSNQKT